MMLLWFCGLVLVAVVAAQDDVNQRCPPDITRSCLEPLDQLEVPQAPGVPEVNMRKMCSVWTACLSPSDLDCECQNKIGMHMLRAHEESYLYCKDNFPGFPASKASMHLMETCFQGCMAEVAAGPGLPPNLIPETQEDLDTSKLAMPKIVSCFSKCPIRTKFTARYLYAMTRLYNHTIQDFHALSNCGQEQLTNCEQPIIWQAPFDERCKLVEAWTSCSQHHLASCGHNAADVQKYLDLYGYFSADEAYLPCGCTDVDMIAEAIREAEAFIDTTE